MTDAELIEQLLADKCMVPRDDSTGVSEYRTRPLSLAAADALKRLTFSLDYWQNRHQKRNADAAHRRIKEIKALRKALEHYGEHAPQCRHLSDGCSCGLRAALARGSE